MIDEKIKKEFFDLCFNAYWRDNIDISNQKNLSNILDNLKIDKKRFLEDIQTINTKNELKQLTKIAFEKDIFGAPTFVVNEKIFWGQDRLDYALDEYFA